MINFDFNSLYWNKSLIEGYILGEENLIVTEIPKTEANYKNLCPLSADISEIKRHFYSIKEILHSKDQITDVSLLNVSKLNKLKHSERCCFLLQLTHFYVNNVFTNVEFNTTKEFRSLHHLANSIISLKMELKDCHSTMRCYCGDQSHQMIKDFKAEYHKLNTEAAALKAVGDLNILLHWIEKSFLN
ncbi:interleukin-20-like [Pelobates fuscus]|uniref:interleukin-20-like n=1 Tax=Pelobates fuscus TaxID=191477 RepID=UPI002FE4E306